MIRYSKQKAPSPETQDEAMKIARAHQRPGQTKEQTRLIAQGIQKGIAEYKKQQKARTREQDRQRKQQAAPESGPAASESAPSRQRIRYRQHPVPWILLLLSWALFAVYIAWSRA